MLRTDPRSGRCLFLGIRTFHRTTESCQCSPSVEMRAYFKHSYIECSIFPLIYIGIKYIQIYICDGNACIYHFESHLAGVDLGDGSWLESIDRFAEVDSVFQRFVETVRTWLISCWKGLPCDFSQPRSRLAVQLLVVFCSFLYRR